MHKIIAIQVFLLLILSKVAAQDLKYGPWQTSNVYAGIEYRVAFDHYNESAAKNKHPPYMWSLQIKSNYSKKIDIQFGLTDKGKAIEQIRDKRHHLCLKPGEKITEGMFFMTTSEGGSVEVYFWKLEDCNR